MASNEENAVAGLASAVAGLAGRLAVLEAELRPVRKLSDGNGRPPLAERLLVIEEWVRARRRWEWMIASAVVGALAVAAVALLTARLS